MRLLRKNLISAHVEGQVVGPIWQGPTCTQEFRLPLKATVRETLLAACQSGDFQAAYIDFQAILVLKYRIGPNTIITHRHDLTAEMKAICDLFANQELAVYA